MPLQIEAPKALPRPDYSKQRFEDLLSGKTTCHDQEQSPLFQIPPEIRNDIFAMVAQEQNGETAINKAMYWYRPDYTHCRYIDTALLRTCKRIWAETHALPRQQILRRYWLGGYDRRPSRNYSLI
jgi:hypothetical protein